MPASNTCRRAGLLASLIVVLASLEGCGGALRGVSRSTGRMGVVRGTVIAADGRTPIADATVALDGAGVMTRSGPDGSYTLKGVPAGSQVIVASRGVFISRSRAEVRPDAVTRANDAPLRSAGKLAFVRGATDTIEDIVDRLVGNPIDEIRATDLGQATITAQYRMILLNCGLDEALASDPAIVNNLREFVRSGGTLYASDHAAGYVHGIFPAFMARHDGEAQVVLATLTDPRLASFVGRTRVNIHYDLGAWATIASMPAAARVLARGVVVADAIAGRSAPLAIEIPLGAGRVIFTTFHNRAGVTEEQVSVLKHFIYLP